MGLKKDLIVNHCIMKTKIKSYEGKITTNFHDDDGIFLEYFSISNIE